MIRSVFILGHVKKISWWSSTPDPEKWPTHILLLFLFSQKFEPPPPPGKYRIKQVPTL